jgi:hypothetical protein
MFCSRVVINLQTDFWKDVNFTEQCQSLSAQKIMISSEIWISRVILKISHITPVDLCQIRLQKTTKWKFISTIPSSQEHNTETGRYNIPINHKTGERPFLSCRIYEEL